MRYVYTIYVQLLKIIAITIIIYFLFSGTGACPRVFVLRVKNYNTELQVRKCTLQIYPPRGVYRIPQMTPLYSISYKSKELVVFSAVYDSCEVYYYVEFIFHVTAIKILRCTSASNSNHLFFVFYKKNFNFSYLVVFYILL